MNSSKKDFIIENLIYSLAVHFKLFHMSISRQKEQQIQLFNWLIISKNGFLIVISKLVRIKISVFN